MSTNKPILEIQHCKHVVEQPVEVVLDSQNTIEQILNSKMIGCSKVVMWLNNAVVFGHFENGTIIWGEELSFDPIQFLELRAFNKNEEIHIVDGYYVYTRDYDDADEETEYVETSSRLWGRKIAASGNFTVLNDSERKLTLVAPVKGEKDYYELVTRTYISYVEKTGQATYSSYRFLDIVEGRE